MSPTFLNHYRHHHHQSVQCGPQEFRISSVPFPVLLALITLYVEA